MKSYIAFVLLFLSCSPIKGSLEVQDSPCNENLKFKTEFFKNIENIESHITTVKDESFDNSLKFISKYTDVSFESMMNYARTYPIGAFEKDKEVWLKWYEENKCQNIQFK